MPKELWDYRQTAERLGVRIGTLYAWVHERRIPHIRFSGKFVRFDPEEIEIWLRTHAVPTPESASGQGRQR